MSSACSASALSCLTSRSSLLFASLATLSRVEDSVYEDSSLAYLLAAFSSSLDFFSKSFSSDANATLAALISSISVPSARSRSFISSASFSFASLFNVFTCARSVFASASAVDAHVFKAST